MKYKKSKQTSVDGELYVSGIVNSHGSIYRAIHQETDIGLDGTIEFVQSEYSTGLMIAVQIKSGSSFLSSDRKNFKVSVSDEHLKYWLSYSLPVIIVCYCKKHELSGWISINDYVKHRKYHNKDIPRYIEIPTYRAFTLEAMDEYLIHLAHAFHDEKNLIHFIENCLDDDLEKSKTSFEKLYDHPASRQLKITVNIARKFLMSEDLDISKLAMHCIGYAVGRKRWSWNPNNKDENEVIEYGARLCSELTTYEVQKMLNLTEGARFRGPDDLGERFIDISKHLSDSAWDYLIEKMEDEKSPIDLKARIYFLYIGGDDWKLDDIKEFGNASQEELLLIDYIDNNILMY